VRADVSSLLNVPYQKGGMDCLGVTLQALALMGFGELTLEDVRHWSCIGSEACGATELGDLILTKNGEVQGLSVLVNTSPPQVLTSLAGHKSRVISLTALADVEGVYRRP
jgi:hypothetical protein